MRVVILLSTHIEEMGVDNRIGCTWCRLHCKLRQVMDTLKCVVLGAECASLSVEGGK